VLHGGLVSDFHTCDFGSHTSLCFFEGRRMQGWGRGQVVVLDSQYRSVVTVQGEAITGLADMHEFNLIDSGRRAIITAYSVDPFDGTNLNFTEGFTWILNSYFKEINVTSGEIIFEWNALEHFVPATQPSELSPPGTSRLAPLDFFHLNSVTKSLDGDYIISARHTSAIYKVSHVDGHVIWQLGGGETDFEADFNFCHQHHALIMHESPHKMILSMFDNGCTTNAGTRSSAKTVELNMLNMTAVLLNEYGADANVAVKTQGSAQCCEVTSSYATTPLLFEQRGCCLNNAPTKLMRGDYVAVCIYQFPLSYLTRISMRCPTKRTTALTTLRFCLQMGTF